jgi:lysophospholipase L1-like esterase
MNKILVLIPLFMAMNMQSQEDQLKMDWANLKKYALENSKLKAPSTNEHRVVFMGNSITESWKDIDSSFFIKNSYINRGISGQTTSQMLVRFPQDVISIKPEVVVILAGINDIAQNTGPISLGDIFGNIVSMAQLAQMNEIKVILCSVLPAYDFPWHPGLKPAEKVVELNAMIKSYCKENNIAYLDYFTRMVDERNGLNKKYTNDGIHPTIEGYKVMEPLVQGAIQKTLK